MSKVKVRIECEAIFENSVDTCKVGIYVDGTKVGSAELYKEKSKRFGIDYVHIKRKYRNMGNGIKMIKAIGRFADKRGWILMLEARMELVPFYKLAGFKVYKIDDERAYMSRKPSRG